MQDIFGSVRRSLVFRTTDGGSEVGAAGALVDRINTCIRKSRVFSKPSLPIADDGAPEIRWRKGELIGCGAFGRVYMGMNLDSGELLAVKQVSIASNGASKEKAQVHMRELEEEVKLLKNLSHPNIVRYLGTIREEETMNILLEFVPGGSISSLLGKFGSFPETVIRTYTKQLLQGLDFLHKNGIMHRDIKGANILVDNKGCIKLADFGASKQVVELATVSGAKSMKGTPYWMAPEVILQTGHSFSADIWSVGCTVIEMATGKPPWSQQYQEVAALFHIGTTKSHPPIPEHLSREAKDFLLKCLRKEPEGRLPANELLKHPFVTGEFMESPVFHTTATENFKTPSPAYRMNLESSTRSSSMDVCNLGSLSCPAETSEKLPEDRNIWVTNNSDDDMCLIDDKDDFIMAGEVKFSSILTPDGFNKSFNPICEPADDWRCNYDAITEPERRGDNDHPVNRPTGSSEASEIKENDFSFHCGRSLSEDDDEATESRIRAFLDEKALELKKLQTPLYEEFYNSLTAAAYSPNSVETTGNDTAPTYLKLPPKSRSPSQGPLGSPSPAVDSASTASPGSSIRHVPPVGSASNQSFQETQGLVADALPEPSSPSVSFSERQKKWKEELDEELERKREIMRHTGAGGKTSSPKDRALNRQRERSRFASPGK